MGIGRLSCVLLPFLTLVQRVVSRGNSERLMSTVNDSAAATPAATKGRVLYDFAPGDTVSQLKLHENDVVDVLAHDSPEWTRVQLGEARGVVPASYVKVLPIGRTAVALFDFVSDKRGHLPFSKDDEVTVVEEQQGWVRIGSPPPQGFSSYTFLFIIFFFETQSTKYVSS